MSSDFKAKATKRNTVSDEGDSSAVERQYKVRERLSWGEGRKQDYFSKCQVVLEQKVLFSFHFNVIMNESLVLLLPSSSPFFLLVRLSSLFQPTIIIFNFKLISQISCLFFKLNECSRDPKKTRNAHCFSFYSLSPVFLVTPKIHRHVFKSLLEVENDWWNGENRCCAYAR